MTVHVAGPAHLQVATPASGALEDLGYSRNGVDVTFRGYYDDVPSDLMGGELGPPLDVQYFGETADIQCQLTSYQTSVYNKVQAQLAAGTAGTPGTPGTLMFSELKAFRLRITSTIEILNFVNVVFRQPREINKGTRFSQAVVVATAYENDSGVLYNAT